MGCCWSTCAEEKEEVLEETPPIGLSDKLKAAGVSVDGTTISGTGSVLADAPVLQDKGYFEATIVKGGTFALGVATKDSPLDGILAHDKVPSAWTVTNSASISDGDVIGCAVDQADYPVQVYFYKGSQLIEQMSGVRGEVLPAFSVGDGAIIEANFGKTEYGSMPAGFQGIIKCQSLL